MILTPREGDLAVTADRNSATVCRTRVWSDGWELGETVAELPLDLPDDADGDTITDAADAVLEAAGFESPDRWDMEDDQWSGITQFDTELVVAVVEGPRPGSAVVDLAELLGTDSYPTLETAEVHAWLAGNGAGEGQDQYWVAVSFDPIDAPAASRTVTVTVDEARRIREHADQ